MSKRLEAVYENGVLRPLAPVDLEEHQRVTVTIEASGALSKDDTEGHAEASPLPQSGAELVAYWEKRGFFLPYFWGYR